MCTPGIVSIRVKLVFVNRCIASILLAVARNLRLSVPGGFTHVALWVQQRAEICKALSRAPTQSVAAKPIVRASVPVLVVSVRRSWTRPFPVMAATNLRGHQFGDNPGNARAASACPLLVLRPFQTRLRQTDYRS